MQHPYKKYEDSLLWKTIEKEVDKLEKNNDMIITTSKENIIGFICKKLDNEKLIETAFDTEKSEKP